MSQRDVGYINLCLLAGELLISSKDEYATNRSTLKFHCKKCNEIFITTSFLYKKTETNKHCTGCRTMITRIKLPDFRETYITKFKKHHGEYYNYDKVPDIFLTKDQLSITCPKHGDFQAKASTHASGNGKCPICFKDERSKSFIPHNLKTQTEFINQANKKHKFRYNYSKVEYVRSKDHVTIICAKHGEFEQTPNCHLNQGTGCPMCTNTSAAVLSIIQDLEKMQIPYITEKTFMGCTGVGQRGITSSLKFDLYLPDRNLCIEYDGPHHFGPFKYGSITDDQAQSRFLTQQQNDNIKDRFCEDNNIELIRIPHTVMHPDAFIRKYLTHEKTPTHTFYHYTYGMLSSDVQLIANYINSFGYDRFAIYGISRGGLLWLLPLSYHFEAVSEYGIVTFQRYDFKSRTVKFDITHKTRELPIFIIDDLVSSGITMNRVVAAMKHKFRKAKVHPVVVFGESNDDGVFFLHDHPKQWIVFPHEMS
jgi:hypoxanthine phosphoribosyltransferase